MRIGVWYKGTLIDFNAKTWLWVAKFDAVKNETPIIAEREAWCRAVESQQAHIRLFVCMHSIILSMLSQRSLTQRFNGSKVMILADRQGIQIYSKV